MLERWTRTVLRFRAFILVCWLVVLVAGSLGAAALPRLLSSSYAVPGTESERARTLLEGQFGEQPEGTFVAVFEVTGTSEELEVELQRRLERAAENLPVELTPNEWVQAGRHRDSFWLYVVWNAKTKPRLLRVQDPVAALKDDIEELKVVNGYRVPADAIARAAS